MLKLLLIGIGTGNPDHLTLQAVKALKTADLVLVPIKGEAKADLADVRREILREHMDVSRTTVVEFEMPRRDAADPDYRHGVDRWHDAIAEAWQRAFDGHLSLEEDVEARAALLVWGDPSLYDSTLRIAARLAREREVEVEVIPGLTSVQLLTAAHTIPLNEVGAPVLITTGRQLRDHGWPAGAETLVVMLDGATSFETLQPDGIEIWWGAYLGLPPETIIGGPLADVGAKIVATRTALRAEHGWIMDVYLLRRTGAG